MKAPESLRTLMDYGIIQEVVRPLMSGKEAQVYVVVAGGEECVAKVYKEAIQRNFKQRVEYTEGRRTRNSRDQRAINKRTKHGRKQDESAWRNTEVDMIYRLRDAGVRVPEPINFVDGVLVMELVRGGDGHPAPRLGDLDFSQSEAVAIHQSLIREVVRMLCAGVIHGDLSEFNVLMSGDGPVVIDFPQSVDPANNRNAGKLLLRDVENLDRFLARYSPAHRAQRLGPEIWALFESNELRPDTELTGKYVAPEGKANTDEVLALIGDAERDEQKRRGDDRALEDDDDFESVIDSPRPRRIVVDFAAEAKARSSAKKAARPKRRREAKGAAAGAPPAAGAVRKPKDASGEITAAKPKRSRRRRTGRVASGEAAGEGADRKGAEAASAPKAGATPKRSRRRRARRGAKPKEARADAPKAVGPKGEQGAPAPGAKAKTGEASNPARPPRRRRRRPTAARRPE